VCVCVCVSVCVCVCGTYIRERVDTYTQYTHASTSSNEIVLLQLNRSQSFLEGRHALQEISRVAITLRHLL